MYKNFALLSARKSGLDFYTNQEQTQMLRDELLRLGLQFDGVMVNGVPHFLVVSSNLKLIKKLAKDFKCGKFYISDCYRTLFEVSLIGNKYSPTSLGTLKRSSQSLKPFPKGEGFSLLVEHSGTVYSYIVETIPQFNVENA